jgi:glycyl-tRNA synthetase beta chain
VQGIAGAYLARVAGLDPQVADAIRDHYKPVGQGDDVPTAPVSVAVALADKLDTLVGFFAINERPTGSRDPYALRRSALGILSILMIEKNLITLGLTSAFRSAYAGYAEWKTEGFDLALPLRDEDDAIVDYRVLDRNSVGVFSGSELHLLRLLRDDPLSAKRPVDRGSTVAKFLSMSMVSDGLLEFIADRLKVQQREAGVRHDLIDAVFALGGEDDLARLLARVKALEAFVATDDGVNLLAGYRRAANILKIELAKGADSPAPGPSRRREGSEAALGDALDSALPAAAAAVAAEDFAGAMTALSGLRAPVDAFFAEVMVNDPDPDVRADRLGLLARFRDAVHSVADFSKIEG